jgi:colanic acid/amylovoran biosynthesis glycosyltransferase
LNLAYIAGFYPAISQSFIKRELQALRELGVSVDTYAVHPAPEGHLLTDQDREEAARTRTIQPPVLSVVAKAHVRAVLSSPRRYLTTLVRALRLSPGGLRQGLLHLAYFAEAIVLWSYMRPRAARHLHAHFATSANMIALLCTRFGGPGWSWSFTMHGPTEFEDVTRYRLGEKVHEARFVVCISDFARSQLMRLTEPSEWEKLRIVRCGVDPALYGERPPERGRGHGHEVLCVGRLVPEKGQRLLLSAIRQLRDEGLDVRVRFIGDGPERPALEAEAQRLALDGAALFEGNVGSDRVPDHYARADVFCLPSFAEGVPVVLMEALASEVPVVTTRIAGVAELVRHGENGLLVPPGRVDALTDALRTLLGDDDLRRRLGAAGRRLVLAEYDSNVAAAQLKAVFEEFLGEVR